ncbi:hypothetical protein DAEQUDRAFT_350600 [Daedalea quercina L-15889]|uniref:Uncharacterized protein n=1 Tax=Daedalea quercina L-15889 TaxID=1314783 RepID=A0A165PEF8_9APHY|nr:hypothetical protein DAEQUDRAFT_350600 [Daedalea quercina L-15889]
MCTIHMPYIFDGPVHSVACAALWSKDNHDTEPPRATTVLALNSSGLLYSTCHDPKIQHGRLAISDARAPARRTTSRHGATPSQTASVIYQTSFSPHYLPRSNADHTLLGFPLLEAQRSLPSFRQRRPRPNIRVADSANVAAKDRCATISIDTMATATRTSTTRLCVG